MYPQKKSQPRGRGERGSVIVETTLVLLVAITMLIGILDMGQVLFQRASVVERVRSALRHGVLDYNQSAIRNIVLYGTATPADGATPSFNLTASMVEVARLDANSTADRLRITVSNYPIDFYTPFIAGRVTGPAIVAVQPMELAGL